nr:reverse transcriptase domain-containing protein [Tanacetum cinerariifolium]
MPVIIIPTLTQVKAVEEICVTCGGALKALLSNKEKLQELSNTPLNENCSAVILKKLPEKLRDPGKFLIPCGFSELKCKALADLGASINLMPLSVWKKLGLPDLIPTRMTLELANRAIYTPDGIARDVFVPVGKFTFLADFFVVDYESDPRVPLILGRPFLRTARALIDVHGEEMILRDGDERLTLNMKHDTASYSNHPRRESVNLINIFNLSSEDCLEDLVSNKKSGNPTFSLHKEIASREVIHEFHDSKGCTFLSEELPDIDSFNDIHPYFNDDLLSGSTTYSANSLLEEFADELDHISYPLDYDDNRVCDIESDIREIEFLLFQGEDSDFKDSIDQSILTHCDNLFVDPTLEMFIDEQPPDYSFPPSFDVYPDDFLEIESDATFNDDSFDSEGEKIKEAELLIDQLDLPCDILSEPFVGNQDPGKNSSQSPSQINHHCCYGCANPLEGIFCHQCTCELWGNGAHYGYNFPPKVPIIPNPEPFNNQTIKEHPPTVQSFDPKYDLVHNSPNVFDPPLQLHFIPCEFCWNDARYGHYCTPQVPFVYPEPCYNQDFNFPPDLHDFQQQYLCCENYGVTHEAYQSYGTIDIHVRYGWSIYSKKEEEKQIEEDQSANARYWKIPACYGDDDDDYTFAITPNEPDNSLSMEDEHLDTIPATESNKFIMSSVENLVPIPSESEGEPECDMPACEEFKTFSNILFDFDYDFYSSDDQLFSNEDFLKEIYSNPLFDEENISMKIDSHHFNVESDLIESMLNHDSSIISFSKIDSLFDEFTGELTLLKSIPPEIDETDCDPKEETHFIKRLLYDNSSPRPPKEFVSENSDAEIESFSPFPIPVEDSDSLIEEIDLSFTLDYPMPPGIEEDDYDSERDILILDELLSNNSLSLPENESFHFDIPLLSRPPAKPPDAELSEASFAVTYTSVHTDSKPGRVFWGADKELSDGGSPWVIVYGYDGLPMMPVAQPSPYYIPGPEEPQTPPSPQEGDEHELMFIQPHDPNFVPEPIYLEYIPLEDEHILPAEEQPLPPIVSPTAESPGYVAELDPEEDPEEDEAEDGPVDYPMDGRDDGDNESDSNSSGYDVDVDEEEEEEEHLALADTIVAEVERLLAMPTPPPSPLTSLSPPYAGERLARCTAPATLPSPSLPPSLYPPPPVDRKDGISESEQPPRKRLCLATLGSRYEVGESSTRGRGVDYGFADIVEAEMRHRGIK